jgi:ATP-dependent Clp protease ATP-binding subunit ClpC
LQLLEEGIVTDSKGHEINFKNTIVIMTSNIGAHHITKDSTVGFGVQEDNTEQKILKELKNTLRPEFINRLDEIIIFNGLKDEHFEQITKNLIGDVKKRLYQNKISIKFNNNIYEFIANKCINENSKQGARPIKRLITTHIENKLADFIIDHNIIDKRVKINCKCIDDEPTFEVIE